MNTLISIGFLGDKRCYLNIPLEEAKKRFAATYYGDDEVANPDDFQTETFEFTDEFCAYEVWGL